MTSLCPVLQPLHYDRAATPNSVNLLLQGGPKNGTVFWYTLTSSNINRFKIISLSESGENV